MIINTRELSSNFIDNLISNYGNTITFDDVNNSMCDYMQELRHKIQQEVLLTIDNRNDINIKDLD